MVVSNQEYTEVYRYAKDMEDQLEMAKENNRQLQRGQVSSNISICSKPPQRGQEL